MREAYTQIVSDSRDAHLTCPACGDAMAWSRPPGEGDDSFWQCTTCAAIWVDWWGGEPSGIARNVVPRPPQSTSGQRGKRCPVDDSQMVDRPYLDAGPVVARCPTCLGLFARREQVAELAAFHERIPVDAPEPIVWVSVLDRFWHAFIK